jgi:iron complex transport system ATP-binding protein
MVKERKRSKAMATESSVLLRGVGLNAGYGNNPDVFRRVDVSVRRREILCIVGPNGSGKSTLLSVLAGVLAPRSGKVMMGERDLSGLSYLERAQKIGYLPQSVRPFTSYLVRELISLGRFPHARGLGFETSQDRAAVEQAMALTRVEHLGNRPFDEISGGERQRVLIASVLATQPDVLLLDEPTAALDIGQRSMVFHTLKELADQGVAVAVVTHDLNLAGLFADVLVLLSYHKVGAYGPPEDVITQDNLRQTYGDGFVLVSRTDSAVPGILPSKMGVEE